MTKYKVTYERGTVGFPGKTAEKAVIAESKRAAIVAVCADFPGFGEVVPAGEFSWCMDSAIADYGDWQESFSATEAE
jgi:hypothetical protein